MPYPTDYCAFHFTDDKPYVRAGEYALDKFKECLDCQHFDTICEDYKCNHPQGRLCLLQINTNHFQKAQK